MRDGEVQCRLKGLEAAPGGRKWTCPKSVEGCTYEDPCPSCKGRRVRREGLRKQRQAKQGLGIPSNKFHGQDGHEERWLGAFRHEVKSQGFAKPVATKFLLMEAQAEAARAIGDGRPFLATFMPDHWGSDGIVAMRLSVWNQMIAPLIEDYEGLA